MKCNILKGFSFSRDGVTPIVTDEGEQVDIPDTLVPGLVKAGFVETLTEESDTAKTGWAPETKVIDDAPETGETVKDPDEALDLDEDAESVLPEDWRELQYAKMWELASEIGIKGKPTNKKLLIAAIEDFTK